MNKIPQYQINKAKEFPIAAMLEYFGFMPCEQRGSELIYFSPFRNEKTPSFSVNVKGNVCKDFADDNYSGDAIRVYRNLTKTNFFTAVHDLYNNKINVAQSHSFVKYEPIVTKEKKQAEIIDIKNTISNKNLIHYLESRCINPETANKYCKEIHYKQPNGKIYYAIGFPNNSGGYELRSANFKSCVREKGISIIQGKNNESAIVFEGFFNMLSWLEYLSLKGGGRNEAVSIVVLNSTSLWKQLPFYKAIYCMFDKDATGLKTIEKINQRYQDSNVFDYSKQIPYKTDLNDYLIEMLSK